MRFGLKSEHLSSPISCLTEGSSAEMDCLDSPEVKIYEQKSEGLERRERRDWRNNHAPPLTNRPTALEKVSAGKRREHVTWWQERGTHRETSTSAHIIDFQRLLWIMLTCRWASRKKIVCPKNNRTPHYPRNRFKPALCRALIWIYTVDLRCRRFWNMELKTAW